MWSNASAHLQELGINPKEILAELNLPAEPYTIYVSGSIVEGFGNADSDLDVYIVYPEQVPVVAADFNLGEGLISIVDSTQWRLDIESWSQEQILAIAQRFHAYSLDDWNQSLLFKELTIDFAHKLRVGIPILHPENFQQLYEAFDFSKVSHAIMAKNLVFYNGTQEDAAGAITSKQYGTALLTARNLIELAIDVLIASYGETNNKSKWRFFKLEKLNDPIVLKQYWELETPSITTEDDILEYAKQCITFASNIVLDVQKKINL